MPPPGDGGRGRHFSFEKRSVPPTPPQRETRGDFDFNTVAALRFPAPFRGRQSRRFLETGSLHPPLAALRLFPPHPLTTQRGGAAAPPLWIPLPGIGRGSAKRSGERGKRSRAHTSTSPESHSQVPKCGEHVPCSFGVRRTRQEPGRFLPHGFARPPHLSKKGAKGAGFAPNIFSFPPCTAHFLFDVSKRKWGVHPPSPQSGGTNPIQGADSHVIP